MICPDCRSHQTRKLRVARDRRVRPLPVSPLSADVQRADGRSVSFLEMPTDIVFQVVLFRLLFKLNLQDLMNLFLTRGYELSCETVRDGEAHFAPLLADYVRRRQQGRMGRCGFGDATYLKVSGCQLS